jgi:hypothetical protein
MKKNLASGFLLSTALLLSCCSIMLTPMNLRPQEKQAQALVGHPISDAYALFGNETEEHPERNLVLRALDASGPLTTHVWSHPYDGTHQVFIQTGSSEYMTNGALVDETDGYYQAQQNWLIIVLYTNANNTIVDWNSFDNGQPTHRNVSPKD